MTSVQSPAARRGFGQTSRSDAWWLTPLLTFLGLGSFIVYSTWAAFQGEHYTHGGMLSPFYSPELFGPSHHNWFGPIPEWFPSFLPQSPALFILWMPGLFRFTCYYYRGAYYKAFWGDPPACAVGELRNTYLGENSLPLVLQNAHRYALYLAIPFLFILGYDAYLAAWFEEDGGKTFGISVGTIVLTINVILLSSYTLGCHAFRHIVGGFMNVFSGRPVRKKMFECVTKLNERHMLAAWMSLFWVGFSDLYVRMCSMGIWTDWRIL